VPVNRSSAPQLPERSLPARSCVPRRRRNPTPFWVAGDSLSFDALSVCLPSPAITSDLRGSWISHTPQLRDACSRALGPPSPGTNRDDRARAEEATLGEHADVSSAVGPQRDAFAVPAEIAYFNTASLSPQLHRVRAAGQAALERRGQPWTISAQ